MGTFKGWTREGQQLWYESSDEFPTGQIDYLGNGFIISNTINNINLFQIGVGAGTNRVKFIKQLVGWAATTDGIGIAVNHTRLDLGDDWQKSDPGFDGLQHYVGRRFGTDAIAYDIQLRDHSTGTSRFVHQLQVLGVTIIRCMAWDGHYLWALTSGEANAVRQLDVGHVSGVGHIVKLYSTSLVFTDMCFDGHQFWTITGTGGDVRCHDPDRWNAGKVIWSHGLTNPKGLTFDGRQLITLSN